MITKNCGCEKEKGCGCGDNVIKTNLLCTTQSCADPEKCSETFSSDCILYMGPTIANLDIQKGMPLSTVIQKLALATINPPCAYPSSPCQAVVGVDTTSIGSTFIKLKWNALPNVITYSVEYRKSTDPNWILNPAVTTNSDMIGGLTPATEYVVRIITNCGGNPCYSLVFSITTKP